MNGLFLLLSLLLAAPAQEAREGFVADIVPPEGAREWAASYRDARLLMARRSGHLIHVEEPGLFFPAIETFLAGGWPEGAERP